MTMKTNPAYLELAYRKAIVGEVIQLLRAQYTPAYGDEPEKTVVCEDVFRDDSEVPQAYLEDFIADLTKQEADLDLELNRFEFVRRQEEHGSSVSSAKAAKGGGVRRQARGKAKAKRGAGN